LAALARQKIKKDLVESQVPLSSLALNRNCCDQGPNIAL
jgi:hypothetical protein